MRPLSLALAFALASPLGSAFAQAPAPAEAAKPAETKKPSKAELGEMLKKCSEEADAKGLTVQKGKAEARKSYRRSCMLKNGVAPNKK